MKFINPTGPGTYDLPDTKSKKGPKNRSSFGLQLIEKQKARFSFF